MSRNAPNYSVEDIRKILADLIDAKNTLANGLSDVKVIATVERDPDVITALKGLFGDNVVKDGKAVITFQMIADCMNVVRNAGKHKAKELIV